MCVMRCVRRVRSALAGSLVAASCALAGPLAPPPGPVTSTYKTLVEVEPRIAIGPTTTPGQSNAVYRITESGSYYLTEDLLVPASMVGIDVGFDVAATIDLNGFEIRGQFNAQTGIRTESSIIEVRSVVVRNGHISGMREYGLRLRANSVVVEDVIVSDCGSHGMLLDPLLVPARIARCTVRHCALDFHNSGLRTDSQAIPSRMPAVIVDCVFLGNGGSAIQAGPNSIVERALVDGGDDGIAVMGGSRVEGCVIRNLSGSGPPQSQRAGVRIFDGSITIAASIIKDCVVNNVDGTGFLAGGSCVISNSVALNCALDGFNVGTGAVVTGCEARDNVGIGIRVNSGSVVSSCVARLNDGDGVLAASGSRVVGCAASSNGGDGIEVSTDAYVADCVMDANGGAGIHVTSVDNRIEGNLVTDSPRGIDVDASGNVIIRNSASGNTMNFDIVAGTDVGPIGTAAASTSPWANIQF